MLGVLFFAALYEPDAYAGDLQDAANQAASLGSTAREKYGSKDAIRQNISNPFVSGSPISTLDGSGSFNAQLICPSSRSFLDVFVQPGFTGDLATVILRADRDMDGEVDYSYQVPYPVSGVCSNGVISCSPGTWSGCKHYKWKADSSASVTLNEAAVTDLGGCYCINNSCGNNLAFKNISVILKDLGGGAAGAMQALNPRYAISDARIDGTAISYYGQNVGGCSIEDISTGVGFPEQYYQNPVKITSDAESLRVSQSGDPESYYSLLSGSLAMQKTASELKTCQIDRLITVSTDKESISGDGSGSICNDHYLYGRVRKIDEYNYKLQLLDTGPGGKYHKNCGGGGDYEDWHTIKDISAPDMKVTDVLFCVNASGSGCSPGSACVYFVDSSMNIITCGSSGAQTVNYSYTYVFEAKKDKVNEAINNTCAALESDSKCRLKEEIVDGVYTIREFISTGLVPQSSCRDFAGEVDIHRRCYNWWQKKRTYICEGGEGFNFEDAKKRVSKIIKTVSDADGSLYYSDLRQDSSGGWVEETNTAQTGLRGEYQDCEKACKTKKPKDSPQVSVSGTSAQYQADTQSYDFFYRVCEGSSCPVGTGEQIVVDCQCMDDFAEAASIMQSLRMAGRDLICSDGVAKPL